MGKRKRTRKQTMIYKRIHRKLKIEQHELHLKRGEGKGKQFLHH
jgi:hypothetical protein